MNRLTAPIIAGVFVSTVVLANLLTSWYGLIPAGFGLSVTAGTYAAGLSLGLRDVLNQYGVGWVVAAIVAGTVLSFGFGNGRIAAASALAFGISEMLDMAVYVPLRRSGWRRAVIASNIVGSLADTTVFLAVAGFAVTWRTVGGQLLVKAGWMTVAAVAAGELFHRARARAAEGVF